MNGRHQDLRMQSCQSRFHTDICCASCTSAHMTAVNVQYMRAKHLFHTSSVRCNVVTSLLNEDSACRDRCISVEYATKWHLKAGHYFVSSSNSSWLTRRLISPALIFQYAIRRRQIVHTHTHTHTHANTHTHTHTHTQTHTHTHTHTMAREHKSAATYPNITRMTRTHVHLGEYALVSVFGCVVFWLCFTNTPWSDHPFPMPLLP